MPNEKPYPTTKIYRCRRATATEHDAWKISKPRSRNHTCDHNRNHNEKTDPKLSLNHRRKKPMYIRQSPDTTQGWDYVNGTGRITNLPLMAYPCHGANNVGADAAIFPNVGDSSEDGRPARAMLDGCVLGLKRHRPHLCRGRHRDDSITPVQYVGTGTATHAVAKSRKPHPSTSRMVCRDDGMRDPNLCYFSGPPHFRIATICGGGPAYRIDLRM